MKADPIIEVDNLSRTFGERTVLKDVSLEVDPGEPWSSWAAAVAARARCCGTSSE